MDSRDYRSILNLQNVSKKQGISHNAVLTIYVDASDVALGGALEQETSEGPQPLGFFCSQTIGRAEKI